MKESLRPQLDAKTSRQARRHQSTRGERIFASSHLRTLSGLPRVKKLQVEDEDLVELMVGIQIDMEQVKKREREKLVMFDPDYLSQLVLLEPSTALSTPVRDSSAVEHGRKDWHDWPLMGRCLIPYEVSAPRHGTVLHETSETVVAPTVTVVGNGRATFTLESLEISERFSVPLSPIGTMLSHVTELIEDSPLPGQNSPSPRTTIAQHYVRDSTTLGSLHVPIQLESIIDQFPEVPKSATSEPSTRVGSTGSGSMPTSSLAPRHCHSRSSSDQESRQAPSESSSSSTSGPGLRTPSYLPSPWAEDVDTSLEDDEDDDQAAIDLLNAKYYPEIRNEMFGGGGGKSGTGVGGWDRLVKLSRSKSLSSRKPRGPAYRSTRFPSASL